MVLLGEDTFPSGAWHHLNQLVGDVVRAIFGRDASRDVNDVFELLLVDTSVVVQLGLVLESLKPVHVQMQVQIATDCRAFAENL